MSAFQTKSIQYVNKLMLALLAYQSDIAYPK